MLSLISGCGVRMAFVKWMVWGLVAAAIIPAHRNTDASTAAVLPEAQLIAKDVKVLGPGKGSSAMCAPPGVVIVVPELQGNSEAGFYAEMYVDDMLNLEAYE